MFPVAIAVATVAMSTGIGGAIFFSPIFLLILRLDPTVAIGTALITELFGFTSGLIGYLRQRLIDFTVGFRVLMFSVPAALAGVVLAEFVPGEVLRAIFATGIMFIGWQMFSSWLGERRERLAQAVEEAQASEAASGGTRERRVIVDRSGRRFEYAIFDRAGAMMYGGLGGMLVGMLSVGLAELMEFQMISKCRIPPPVAVATSIFMVMVTVAAASVGHIFSFVSAGPETVRQVVAIAMFTAPGVVIGGQLGPLVQRVAPPEVMKVAISVVFVAVGLFMIASFAFA